LPPIRILAAAAACAAVSACSSHPPAAAARPPSARATASAAHSTLPSGTEDLERATAALSAVPGYTVTASIRQKGTTIAERLRFRPSAGCSGQQDDRGAGTMWSTVIGTTVWFKLDEDGWLYDAGITPAQMRQMNNSEFSSMSPQQLINILLPHWMKAATSDNSMLAQGAVQICSVKSVTEQIPPASAITKETPAAGGQIALTAASWQETVYVTTGASPRITRMVLGRSDASGTYTLSYGPVQVTPPPASTVMPASDIGD
jgi:hypothetical protein